MNIKKYLKPPPVFHRVFSFSGSMSVKLLGTKELRGSLAAEKHDSNMPWNCSRISWEDRWMFEVFFFQVNMSGEKHPLTYLATWEGKRRVWSHFGGNVFCCFSGKVILVIVIPSWYYRILGGNLSFICSSFSMEHGLSYPICSRQFAPAKTQGYAELPCFNINKRTFSREGGEDSEFLILEKNIIS